MKGRHHKKSWIDWTYVAGFLARGAIKVVIVAAGLFLVWKGLELGFAREDAANEVRSAEHREMARVIESRVPVE